MEETRKLIPYSVYLPKEYHDRISLLAKERKASKLIRDAIMIMLDGGDDYKSGYNQGIRDAIELVNKMTELSNFSYKGTTMDELVIGQIEQLEMK